MTFFETLSRDVITRVAALAGTPAYLYDETSLRKEARAALAFPATFGLTVRYAMKACSNAAILRVFAEEGLHIDASSGFEVDRAVRAGIPPENISLSTQELPADFADWVRRGISINACSLSQLERFGAAFPGGRVGLRINPGLGSGGTTKTNVGGPASSFGIWHENLPAVEGLLRRYNLRVFRIHTHIGSGSDPAVWLKVSGMSMAFVERFSGVTHLNLGGGFKVGRMPHEATTDLQVIGAPVKELFAEFAARTGRQIHLEIEPGTYLMANSGAILATVQDMSDTGPDGYRFLKLDTGMTELCRPALYGSQHPMRLIPRDPDRDKIVATADYIAAGHCCESADMLTPKAGESDALEPRTLPEAQIGDWLLIGGTGAYCSAMTAVNYNSFPQAPEVLLRTTGEPALIRRRQLLDQILKNELPVDAS